MNPINKTERHKTKHLLAQQKPTICIGKNGATSQILAEIVKQLKTQETVKIRMLKTALTTEQTRQIAVNIAQQTQATLLEVRGHTFSLHKPDEK